MLLVSEIRPDHTKSSVMTQESAAEANQYEIAHSLCIDLCAQTHPFCMIDANSGEETRILYRIARKLARVPLCFESIITDGVPRGDHDQEPCFR
jgi:hypothetical protein